MRIGEIATRAGVSAKTIRFWEDQRLLPPPERTPSGYRDYEPAVLERLAFIRHARPAAQPVLPALPGRSLADQRGAIGRGAAAGARGGRS